MCNDCHGTGRVSDGRLDPDRLGVLSDSLEDAGCTDATILNHLRDRILCPACSRGESDERWYGGGGGWCAYCDQSGPDLHYITPAELIAEHAHLRPVHVRGDWAVDLLLGKC
jgi:hypothetical protein